MQRMLLALALVATAGVSYAQTMPPRQTMPPGQTTMPPSQSMPTTQTMQTEPRDPYGRPFIGRNDWVRQRGDRPGPASGNPDMATAPAAAAPPAATMPQKRGPRPTAFKDEYGFRYDSEGNRLNAQGYVISPHTR